MNNFKKSLSAVELIIFDFDGVFTDNSVHVSEDGKESVRCSRSDGLGLRRLNEVGVKSCILSTEINPVVTARSKKMLIECFQGVENKGDEVLRLCEYFGVNPEKTAYLGNDINDIAAFEKVGLPIGVADSYNEIDKYILFRLSKNGGEGVVREICDLIYFLKSKVES